MYMQLQLIFIAYAFVHIANEQIFLPRNLDPGQLTTTPKPTGGPTDAPTAGTTGTGPTAAPTTPSPNPGNQNYLSVKNQYYTRIF